MNRLNQLRDRFLMNERFSAAVNSAIIVVMMTCVATMAIQVVERLLPGWQGGHWAGVALVVALESVLSARLAQRLNLSVWNAVLYRVTELIVIFLALKVVTYARAGWGQLLADLPRWESDFNTFFNGEYVFACVLNGGIWLGSWMMASATLELEGDVVWLERDSGVREHSRMEARRRLAGQVFGIGALLLAMVAVVRSNLSLLGIQAPALQSSLINVLLYFVLGLLLISQAHFAVLRATWSLEHISISPDMAQRWTVYSLAMLVGVAAVVALLPTRYSLGLLGTLGYVFSVVSWVVMGVVAFGLMLIGTLLGLLASLFGMRVPTMTAQPPSTAPPPAAAIGPSLPWYEVLKSAAFWVVFIGIIAYAAYYYLSRRTGLVKYLRRSSLWRWLTGVWRLLRGGVKELNQILVAAMQDGWRRLRPARGEGAWRYVSVRNLSPRDRVRFFYQALLRRGAESGLPRQPFQTPYEYENDLTAALPEEEEDVAALTDGFMEARYSQHPVSAQVAEAIHRRWEQVRQALRARREKKARSSEVR